MQEGAMQKALSILAMLEAHLPDIKQALGTGWPALAGQVQTRASSFQNLANEQALVQAANQLLGLLIKDETAREILTRPGEGGSSSQRIALDRREPPKVIRLETIANRFYLLCSQIDKVADSSLDEVVAEDNRKRAASSKREPGRG
jgi:hypothetical protein